MFELRICLAIKRDGHRESCRLHETNLEKQRRGSQIPRSPHSIFSAWMLLALAMILLTSKPPSLYVVDQPLLGLVAEQSLLQDSPLGRLARG